MLKLAVLIPLALAIGTLPSVAASGILDGRTFSGSIGPKGKAADGRDDLIFDAEKVRASYRSAGVNFERVWTADIFSRDEPTASY